WRRLPSRRSPARTGRRSPRPRPCAPPERSRATAGDHAGPARSSARFARSTPLLPSSHAVERLTFRAPDGVELEGELREPDGEPRGSAVICHPHPLQGGSKDHPLLWAIRNELARRGLTV